jgi:hypothetical protein
MYKMINIHLKFLQVLYVCSYHNTADVPVVVQICPNPAEPALIYLLHDSYNLNLQSLKPVWNRRHIDGIYTKLRNSKYKGVKPDDLDGHGIGPQWQIHLPVSQDIPHARYVQF